MEKLVVLNQRCPETGETTPGTSLKHEADGVQTKGRVADTLEKYMQIKIWKAEQRKRTN